MHCVNMLQHVLMLLFNVLLLGQRVAGEFDSLDRTCSDETGPGSLAHSHVLDRLNDKRVVFVGDSVTRYQARTSQPAEQQACAQKHA